ncbi:MAG TPA: hypothetical protein IGS17_15795 [Oscillatoriales cyanobacterium M59_W2019_021]|nr:MAG: hypothetical protein D6728_13635 [Cyanobacteria bacterium J055]HIK33382.1 hypothetical protein [Oscillatoriales cyanobacterium M4454_W2019_049]HIK52370.1 hypothetical protein [Oscillatoriales cyanobacterium M59_W2019_021]
MTNKLWILSLALITTIVLNAKVGRSDTGNVDRQTCSYNGIPLFGKIEIVESSGDIAVQIVDSFPDLNVKVVENFPDECGKWEFVDSFPDFTVEFVESSADIDIKFVDSFPGIP